MTCFLPLKLWWGQFFKEKKTPATTAPPHGCSVQFLRERTQVQGKDTHKGQVVGNSKET